MLVFVYGTLKSGYGNNTLLKTSTFVGSAVTKEEYWFANHGIPFMYNNAEMFPYLKGKNEELLSLLAPVMGEVWDIGDDQYVLRRLDCLEGHPYNYKRERCVVVTETGEELECQAYFYQHHRNLSKPWVYDTELNVYHRYPTEIFEGKYN